MQSRIKRRTENENGWSYHRRWQDSDDGHRQIKFRDLRRRFVMCTAGTATVIVVRRAGRIRRLIVVLIVRLSGARWMGMMIAVIMSFRMAMPAR